MSQCCLFTHLSQWGPINAVWTPLTFPELTKKAAKNISKNVFVSDGFAVTSKWANDDRTFWWTIPLTTLALFHNAKTAFSLWIMDLFGS